MINNNKIRLITFSLVVICAFSVLAFRLFSNSSNGNNQVPSYAAILSITPEITNNELPKYSAWIESWNETKAIESLTANAPHLVEILPVWYQLDKDGSITGINSDHKQEIIALASANNLTLVPTIMNDFDPEKTSNLFDNQDLQDKTINFLINEAVAKNYTGWDIDWEGMYPGDKSGFNDFISSLADNLHEKGKILSVTVQANTGDTTDNIGTQAQDWGYLSSKADFIRIMAYDFHHATSSAGAITPLDFYQKVLNIATSEIPKAKIIIGLPTYGYNWVKNKGEPLQFDEVQQLIKDFSLKPQRDLQSSEMTVKYHSGSISHEVWYEDAESSLIKIKLARTKGINNFTYWKLGGEDPSLWQIK